ncbi:MAG TPA: diguanylate cyclase [Usitatibacter sp.]
MRSGFDDFALTGFVASATAILALAAADYWASNRQSRAADEVIHTHVVRVNIARARLDLMEILARPDSRSYSASVSALRVDLARLRELTQDNPAQTQRLDSIEARLNPHIDDLAAGEIMDAVTTLSSVDGEEARLLDERTREESRTLTWFRLTSGVGIGVMLLVLGMIYGFERKRQAERDEIFRTEQSFNAERKVAEESLRAEVAQRRLAEDALREFITSLETVVEERTSLYTAAIEELSYAKKQLETLAQHDALTGLPNRRLLLDRLKQATSNARRRGSHVAVLFLDLDKFKAVNDTHGHEAGDELLKEVARRLTQCVREGDTVSREGGDEFVLVLSDLQVRDDARRVADKALVELAKPVAIAGQEVRITPSIGVSYYPDDATEPQQLLKCADDAMYFAKDAGRNAVRFFNA